MALDICRDVHTSLEGEFTGRCRRLLNPVPRHCISPTCLRRHICSRIGDPLTPSHINVCSFSFFRRRKDHHHHHHHNPSYHSQSGARPHDSHSRWGAKAERQPSNPPHRRQRHDTDSSDGGSPARRSPVSHKTAPAGATQSHRRRHDTDSDD